MSAFTSSTAICIIYPILGGCMFVTAWDMFSGWVLNRKRNL